ncbi:MAG TPA: hypothetical protein VG757_02110 [Devosia sp.]|nr:hypothetical protein [Devosia sp.]
MRKSKLDRLLLTAVAEALGQPVPKQQRKQRPVRAAAKRVMHRFRPASAEHHAHA